MIKSIGQHLKRVENLAGASILGSGEVVFILNVPDLMSTAKATSRQKTKEKTALPETTDSGLTILVVEDSVMSRELEKNILEASGYDVDVAVDGVDGLSKLEEKSYDLIVSDIEMPRMDGFQFIETLKKDERYKHIPTIIVTSLSKEEEKRRGYEVGAEAYIVKGAFDQTSLLNAVESLIG